MIYDRLNTFVIGEDGTTGVGTNVIGDQIDLNHTVEGSDRDVGNGRELFVMAVAKADITGTATSGTIAIQVVSDSVATLDDSPTVHVTGPAHSYSDAITVPAGTVLLHVALPIEGNVYERYLGIREVVTGEGFATGSYDVFLTLDPHGFKAYPNQETGF